MTIASLVVQVAANTGQLIQDVQKVNATLDGIQGTVSKVAPMLAGAFTIGAVTSYAKEVIDLGGHLVDLRDKTGISVEGLQVLGRAADLSGNSLDQITAAISQMQRRLASGDSGAVSALRQLNLTFADLQSKSPDQQFRTIAAAIAQVEDPAQRVKLAMEIFGKSGADILPTLVSNINAVADATWTMSTRSAEALDAAGDAWTDFTGNVKNVTGGLIADVIESFSSWEGALEGVGIAFGNQQSRIDRELRTFVDEVNQVGASFQEVKPQVNDAMQSAATSFEATRLSLERYLAEQEKAAAAAKRAADETKRHAEQQQRLKDQFLASAAASEKALSSLEFYQNRVLTLQEALGTLGQRWEDLNESVVKTTYGIDAQADALRHLGSSVIPSVSDEMERLGYVERNYFDYGPTLEQARGQFEGFQGNLRSIVSNIPAFFGSLQSSLASTLGGLFGASPNSLLTSVISGGLNFVFGPLSGIATQLISKGMEWLAGVVKKGLQKIGGFFRDLFGGPSADELAGREIVSQFEENIASMLTEQQKVEAGGEAWKATVIAIRDKYLEMGLTEAEALRDAERLWAASREGAEAARAVIADIERKFRGGITVPVRVNVDNPMLGDTVQDGLPDLPMMAAGGIVRRPTLALIGEAGPEAVVPLSQYRQRGSGDVYVEVVNVVDGREVSRSVTRQQSRDMRTRRKLAAA